MPCSEFEHKGSTSTAVLVSYYHFPLNFFFPDYFSLNSKLVDNQNMSNLPLSDPCIYIEDSEFRNPLDPLDDSYWSVYQEILQTAVSAHETSKGEINSYNLTVSTSADVHVGQQHYSGVVEDRMDIVTTPNSKTRKRNRRINDENAAMEQSAEEGMSVVKKLDHNAKERIRRMKLNASYLALRALMPDSRRSKKRWSAPAIVDRVLKYIPELENEVEALRSKKESVKTAAKAKNISNKNPTSQYQSPAVFFNKVNQEEAIIQICIGRLDDQNGSSFTNLLECLEDESICIKNASTLYICESWICHNLHVKVNHTTTGGDHFDELSEKVISSLR